MRTKTIIVTDKNKNALRILSYMRDRKVAIEEKMKERLTMLTKVDMSKEYSNPNYAKLF